jgi:hypothetical protein
MANNALPPDLSQYYYFDDIHFSTSAQATFTRLIWRTVTGQEEIEFGPITERNNESAVRYWTQAAQVDLGAFGVQEGTVVEQATIDFINSSGQFPIKFLNKELLALLKYAL